MNPISETDLHAYVDGRLDSGRQAELGAWLAANPDEQARLADWGHQTLKLRDAYDSVLNEAIPARLREAATPRHRPVMAMAASLLIFVGGGVLGFGLHDRIVPPALPSAALPRWAVQAHLVYSPEVRHPVEVAADQESHLVAWLSKRLGKTLKVPSLKDGGYSLVGGRLLPGDKGAVAQFMFQDDSGKRLTLYVRPESGDKETAFRYASEGSVSVFYWLDGHLAYALSGELPKEELLKVANSVYKQLAP